MANKKKLTGGLSAEQSTHMRELIKSKVLTVIPKQTHLSAFLGIPQGNLSYFLTGTRAGTMAMAFRVAYLLDCPVEDVLGMTRAPKFTDELERRYPSRLFAARGAYLEGVPVERIQSVLTASLKYPAAPGESGDPGFESWLQMLRSKALAKPGSTKFTTRAIELIDTGIAKARGHAGVQVRRKKARRRSRKPKKPTGA